MAWRKPQARRNRGRGHPEVDVRPASMVLVEVDPDHPFVENVGACNRHRGSQSKSGLDEKNHEPSSSKTQLATFFESIQTRTVLSSSFTLTSSKGRRKMASM